jgi:HEAT repeat protein
VSLITALGNMQEGSVAKVLLNDAKSEDKDVRDAALYALACLGTPEAAPLLEAAVEASSGFERSKNNALLLLWRAEAGVEERHVVAADVPSAGDAAEKSNMRCAALTALAQTKGKKALNDLIAAMDDDDRQVRACALELASTIPGGTATKKWVKKAGQVSKEARIEIISMLGHRGDAAAMKMLMSATKDDEKDVRLAAIDAATLVNGPKAVPALLDRMQVSMDADEIGAVKAALLRVPGDKMPAEVGRALSGATIPAREALLEVLAARRASGQLSAVLKCTEDADESVRVSALKSLGGVAGPDDLGTLLNLLLAAQSEAEINAAVDSYVAVAGQLEDVTLRDDLLVLALAKGANNVKPRVMRALAGLGGDEGLAAVTVLAGSPAGEVKDAAVRALADWPDFTATAPLLDVARSTDDLKQNVLALRGYQRLVAVADISPENKVRMYVEAMEAARRPEEKTAILGGLAEVRTLVALLAVAPYLAHDVLKGEAALSAARIACPKDENDAGLKGAEVIAILQKALPIISDADLQAKVRKYIESQAGK